jgi:diguanylate cyclase (GGDEF)-like protein
MDYNRISRREGKGDRSESGMSSPSCFLAPPRFGTTFAHPTLRRTPEPFRPGWTATLGGRAVVKVLLVDDSETTLRSLRFILEHKGYGDIVCAHTGTEALELLYRHMPADDSMPADVILLDVDLPGFDGIETCRRIKADKRLQEIPILIVTGDKQLQTLESAFAAGACDFLGKPIEPVELLARMRSALNLKKELDGCKAREKELVVVTGRLQQLNEELHRLAILDELTGIANRRFFNILLAQEWGRAAREVIPLSLILIDIDFFKNYNDTYGHPRGDECLKKVASTLSHSVKRPTDQVARYGGEEFAVIVPHTALRGARTMAEGLRNKVEELRLEHTGSLIHDHVTISLGVACAMPERGLSPDSLILAADRAVYEAKRGGRNRVEALAGQPA